MPAKIFRAILIDILIAATLELAADEQIFNFSDKSSDLFYWTYYTIKNKLMKSPSLIEDKRARQGYFLLC